MPTTIRKPWTDDELGRLPDGGRYEIDEGALIIMAPAGRRHSNVLIQVGFLLKAFVAQHALGEVDGGEVGVYLQRNPETLRGIDVAFFSNAKVAPMQGATGFLDVLPDLAVEVYDAAEPDLQRKVTQYLAAGIPSVWVLDPAERTLTQYRPDTEPVMLTDPDASVADPVLPGFVCRLGEFFET
ncbi:MAG: Uma2 family endonuclease [Thermaerobacter sp.]|nr:Uma2 family endonuclease [Thermaerobacter sp.]